MVKLFVFIYHRTLCFYINSKKKRKQRKIALQKRINEKKAEKKLREIGLQWWRIRSGETILIESVEYIFTGVGFDGLYVEDLEMREDYFLMYSYLDRYGATLPAKAF